MEIDCLICGQIGMCTFVNSTATIQDDINQEKSKWSKCFCELLDVNTELVPEIECILQSSYYCNHCIPDLQFIYETFCEIEALRERLNSKKDGCKVKLRNASLKCNAADRRCIDPLNQPESATTTSDGEDFKVPVEFDFHPNSDSPSQTLSRNKLLQCLNNDLPEAVSPPSEPELDLKVESENNDTEQDPLWILSSNIFEDENDSQVENMSVPPETTELETENRQGGALTKGSVIIVEEMKSILDNDRIPKPKRFQTKARRSAEAFTTSIEESSQSKRLRSRQTKIQDYSKLNSNSDSDDGPCKDSSDNDATSEEYNSDCDDRHDPDYSITDGWSKRKRREKQNSERKDFFLPTVLSDQDTIKNIKLLEEEYEELIKYYEIKKLRIPVMKLPDDDFDSESESKKIDCKCPIIDCQTRFFKKWSLVEHIRVVHRGIKYPYECKICNKKYSQTFAYKQHLNIHSKTFPYSCPECDYKSPTRKRLQNHKRYRHSLTKFQCDQCGLLCPTRQSYQAHLRSHRSDRPFVCEICGKSYKVPHELRYHRTVHPELNLEQFKCDACGKVFSHAQGLKHHMMGHTGDLPFPCDKCDFRGRSSTLLKLHMNKHIEGKPYECEVCHAKYKSLRGLSLHKNFDCGTDKDSRDFVCDTCGKGFRTIIRLKAHQKVHKIVGKPFLCYICGSSYTAKDNLKRHHKTAHKDVDIQDSSNKTATDHVFVPALPEISGSNSIAITEQVEEGQVLFPGPSEINNYETDLELNDLWTS